MKISTKWMIKLTLLASLVIGGKTANAKGCIVVIVSPANYSHLGYNRQGNTEAAVANAFKRWPDATPDHPNYKQYCYYNECQVNKYGSCN